MGAGGGVGVGINVSSTELLLCISSSLSSVIFYLFNFSLSHSPDSYAFEVSRLCLYVALFFDKCPILKMPF